MAKVIKVENLSKAYRLGEIGTGTIAKDLERFWAKARGKEDPFLKIGETNDRSVKGSSDVVLSLNDLNFEIEQGDAVGIIGRNGAGKSTLLKILSRVTAPTTGSVKIKGRIASLLEVGTGFHPELTGKENIFLNGAILGMRKAEIKRKFDEIVDFSGVERYIDTPVKRYSSGMYVRLAFAVAAYLESEILIVDEVLAVGDAEFQKKCLGKMGDISKAQGRTILFVSHNIGSISQLCNSAILLKNGILHKTGKTENVIKEYLNDNNKNSLIINSSTTDNCYNLAKMLSADGSATTTFKYDDDLVISLKVNIADYYNGLEIAMRLIDNLNNPVFTIHEGIGPKTADNVYEFKITLPGKFVTPGNYSWIMCINHPGVKLYDLHENALSFTIEETGSNFSRYNNSNYGVVFPTYQITRL
ncbi:ABC transporter ATP-binding protein [Mucilaginibacter sp. X4EP1]|uniref:ABC transporter ATP-binding protein n=1 Tax=Mucilaginibacter sp. X4EP1 TaxID=2723092 RepID=UPI00216726E3|nr:ABC transporter ATP-binding protein [Mucilaginibacter sp. X4EP1]MCS3811724.1 lipopolysaccharide transport system ATP-binding protein [Mucilaginibacter sp. X4EP1]